MDVLIPLCRDALEVCIDAGAKIDESVDGLTPLLIACYKVQL